MLFGRPSALLRDANLHPHVYVNFPSTPAAARSPGCHKRGASRLAAPEPQRVLHRAPGPCPFPAPHPGSPHLRVTGGQRRAALAVPGPRPRRTLAGASEQGHPAPRAACCRPGWGAGPMRSAGGSGCPSSRPAPWHRGPGAVCSSSSSRGPASLCAPRVGAGGGGRREAPPPVSIRASPLAERDATLPAAGRGGREQGRGRGKRRSGFLMAHLECKRQTGHRHRNPSRRREPRSLQGAGRGGIFFLF